MLTARLIKETLQEDFDYSTNQEGKHLFDSKSVLSISLSKKSLEATVLDRGRSFYISFEYLEDESFIDFEGYCTCEKEICEHQVATLYAALELKNSSPSIHREINSQNISKKPKSKPLPIPLPIQLDGKHAGEYRLLPMSEGLNFALKRYKPNQYQGFTWNESFEGNFISPTEIELENIFTSRYSHSQNKKKIRLKIEKSM